MLYDLVCNQPYAFFRECQQDGERGVPYMQFKPRHMKQAVPFLIDDVAELYFHHHRDDFTAEEFHNVAPRYPSMWFEFTQPLKARLGNKWIDYETELRDRVSVDVDFSRIKRGIYVHSWDRFDTDDNKVFSKSIPQEARWLFRSMAFISFDTESVLYEFAGLSWVVNGRGRVIPLMDKQRPQYFMMPLGKVATLGAEVVRGYITGMMIPVFMTLALIHCVNVSLVSIPPRKARFKPGSRRGRRLAASLDRDESYTAHHVIEVDISKSTRRRSASQGGTRSSAAWHRVPGQFRHYDGKINSETGRPSLLFGKQKGTFYVPAYHRGTKEAGQITKEYEVKADV